MRIELNPTRVVILPTGAQPTPAPSNSSHSFRELLQRPERLSAKDAQSLLAGAWSAVVGEPPSHETAQLLTAHWALETDAGRAMPGHNFAGIKANAAASGAVFRTLEGHGATRREVSARFRVYDSPESGARDYVSLLKARYPAALAAARVGDTTAFAHALAAGGYFTADPAAYSAGLQQRREALDQGGTLGSTNARPAPGVLLAEVALSGLMSALQAHSEDA